MSRSKERKKQGGTLNRLQRFYPIAGVTSFLTVILFMENPSWAYAAAACDLGLAALCGPVLAYFVKKYEKQEARYRGPKKKDPFDGIEKSLIEQAKPLIAPVRKRLRGKKGDQ
ncbi:MAG: hypothetical protein LBG12_15165 [Synergistaceae bacterium]|jgi:hypothetical protein|nr:hypothetical protein [Synergistaceae bacterium]